MSLNITKCLKSSFSLQYNFFTKEILSLLSNATDNKMKHWKFYILEIYLKNTTIYHINVYLTDNTLYPGVTAPYFSSKSYNCNFRISLKLLKLQTKSLPKTYLFFSWHRKYAATNLPENKFPPTRLKTFLLHRFIVQGFN